jgi:protein CWC15
LEDSDDDDSEDEDEKAALQNSLTCDRKERQRRSDVLVEKEEKSQLEEAAFVGNPLLTADNGTAGTNASQRMKRQWNDDVVFRNQTKGWENQIRIKNASSMMMCETSQTSFTKKNLK